MVKRIDSYSSFFIVLLLVYSFLLFYRLGDSYLTNWDEAWYGDIIRNMAENGNLLTPIWNKEPFFDKPPLYFWFSSISYRTFGPTEFAIRFFSALSAAGAAIVLFFLAKLLFNKKVALISVVVLISTVGFLFRARTGNLDVFLAFWLLFAIFSFYKGYKENRPRWYMMMGLATAMAFLTKGAIAYVFPVFAALFLLVRKDLKQKHFWVSLLLSIATVGAWYVVSYLVNGPEFLRTFSTHQFIKISNSYAFWGNFSLIFVSYLKSGLKVWFLFFVPAFFYGLYRLRNTPVVILFAYLSSFFVLFSFSENKSNWFLVPFYPIIALIVGYSISNWITKTLRNKYSLLAVIVVFILAVIQLYMYKPEYIVPDIAGDEARLALYANEHTKDSDILYLTNYYYPTTIYYSRRRVYAVYSDFEKGNASWIKPKSDWKRILQKDDVYIITTKNEYDELLHAFPKQKFTILFQSGDKLLVKKI